MNRVSSETLLGLDFAIEVFHPRWRPSKQGKPLSSFEPPLAVPTYKWKYPHELGATVPLSISNEAS